MRRWAFAALLLAGCAAPRSGGSGVPDAPKAPGGVAPAEANFQLLVDEVVLDPAQEGASYTVVWVDGAEKGRTAAGPRAGQKRLLLKLEPGNRPLRLEHSLQPPGGEFAPLPPERQPRERFVRVEEGFVTRVFLRFGASGPPEMLVQREPKGTFKLLP
jgi:hypothetical protein